MGVLETVFGTRTRVTETARIAATQPSSLELMQIADSLLGGVNRETAMTIPTFLACRNILAHTVAQISVHRYSGDRLLPLGLLLSQPDPAPGASWSSQIEKTVEDIVLYGRAFWLILATDGIKTETNPDGMPVRARHIRADQVEVIRSDNLAQYDPIDGYRVNGEYVEPDAIIYFDSGTEGVLKHGSRTLAAALELENAARRFSMVEMPIGILRNDGSGHELGPDEARDLVESFSQARRSRSIAYLQGGLNYERVSLNPGELQLQEARAHMATEIARLFGVPVNLVFASPTGNTASSVSYSNLSQDLAALVQTAAAWIINTIEETLSRPTITPRGQRVAFDVQAWLRSDPIASRDYVIALLEAGVIDQAEARSYLAIPAVGQTIPSLTPGVI